MVSATTTLMPARAQAQSPEQAPAQFFCPGVPAPKGSTKAFYVKQLKRAVVTNDNKRTRPWEATVRAAALDAGAGLQQGPLELTLEFRLPRPKGHFGKHGLRPSAPQWPEVKPDLDKLARAVMDAIDGVLYRDDAQVVALVARKRYEESPARVGVLVSWTTPDACASATAPLPAEAVTSA